MKKAFVSSVSKGKKSSLFNFEGTRPQNRHKTPSHRGEHPNGGVAQLGEHLPCTQGVRSSSLLISTKGGRTRKIDKCPDSC